MWHIIGAYTGNVTDTKQLYSCTAPRQPDGGDGGFGLRQSGLSRFFRAALATTSALALAQAMMAMAPRPAAAQTTNWNGSQSNDWFNPGNWSAGVPTNSSSAYIDNSTNNPVIISTPGAVAGATMVPRTGAGVSLSIQGGGTLTSSSIARIGDLAGSAGAATVTGVASAWSSCLRCDGFHTQAYSVPPNRCYEALQSRSAARTKGVS